MADGSTAASRRPARERVLAVFDAYFDHARNAHEHGFRGCGQLDAAAEPPVGHPDGAASTLATTGPAPAADGAERA